MKNEIECERSDIRKKDGLFGPGFIKECEDISTALIAKIVASRIC